MTPPKLLTDLLHATTHQEVLNLVPGEPTEQGELWAFYKGNVPYLLVAHTDTVTRNMSKFAISEMNGLLTVKDKATPLGADDRAGVYACIEIAKRLPEDYKPSILLCDQEESGGLGAKAFKANEKAKDIFSEFNLILELDRKNTTDFINYNSSVELPKKLVTHLNAYDFWDNFGSYSDVSDFRDLSDVAMLNLSIGFHNEHTVNECLNLRALQYTIQRVISLLHDIRPKRCVTTKKQYSTSYSNSSIINYIRNTYKDPFDYGFNKKARYPNTVTNTGLYSGRVITSKDNLSFKETYCKNCSYNNTCHLDRTIKIDCIVYKPIDKAIFPLKKESWKGELCGNCKDYIHSLCYKRHLNAKSPACSSFTKRTIFKNPVTCGECEDFIACDMQNPNLQSCIVPEVAYIGTE